MVLAVYNIILQDEQQLRQGKEPVASLLTSADAELKLAGWDLRVGYQRGIQRSCVVVIDLLLPAS
jgi:hypothetical protein